MKCINEANFNGKKALIRVDYNVPLDEQFNVTDTTRIQRTIKTVSKITDDGGIAILMSHLGRPKGEVNDKFSLRHIIDTCGEVLGRPVVFLGDVLDENTEKNIAAMKPGEIGLLENLRFHPEEEKGDVEFAKQIARLGDAYVNDAFGTAHRAHASTTTIAQFFKGNCYAGFLLYEETYNLEKVLSHAERPFTAIIGGSKVSTKLNIINNLINKVDSLIVAGGMSYTFLHAMGVNIGNSIFEPDMVETAADIIRKAHLKGVDIFCPIDNLCADAFSEDANTYITTHNDIPEGWEGMDIGPRTIKKFVGIIKSAKTILWNGPVGAFEVEKFGKGTKSLALGVAVTTMSGAYSLVGGGDSIAALKKYKLDDFISYISTGGGAMLEYLEGNSLPGIKALDEFEN